ncbi:MAG TPA: hypothetical protein VGM10_12290 [Actinocrinis sp.]|jgi:hypothetical protein
MSQQSVPLSEVPEPADPPADPPPDAEPPADMSADDRRASVRGLALAWAAATVYSVIAGRFAPLSAPGEFAVLIAGAAMMAWALGFRLPFPPPRRRPAPLRIDGRGALVWLVIVLVFTVWEFYALAFGGDSHPTLSALAGPLLAPYTHRAIGYLLWLASGVWIARR